MYYHSYGLCWRPQLTHSLLKLLNLRLKKIGIQDHPGYAESYRPVRVTQLDPVSKGSVSGA